MLRVDNNMLVNLVCSVQNSLLFLSGIKRKKSKKSEVTGTYEKVIAQVSSAKLFVFTTNRKSPSGLSVKKNIHFDNRNKKTLTHWLSDSKLFGLM